MPAIGWRACWTTSSRLYCVTRTLNGVDSVRHLQIMVLVAGESEQASRRMTFVGLLVVLAERRPQAQEAAEKVIGSVAPLLARDERERIVDYFLGKRYAKDHPSAQQQVEEQGDQCPDEVPVRAKLWTRR